MNLSAPDVVRIHLCSTQLTTFSRMLLEKPLLSGEPSTTLDEKKKTASCLYGRRPHSFFMKSSSRLSTLVSSFYFIEKKEFGTPTENTPTSDHTDSALVEPLQKSDFLNNEKTMELTNHQYNERYEEILSLYKTQTFILEDDHLKPSKKEDSKCCICQESYRLYDFVVSLECFHQYHCSCLSQWIICHGHSESSCPICRRNINLVT